jgi:glycosyltransferase 2 family protein
LSVQRTWTERLRIGATWTGRTLSAAAAVAVTAYLVRMRVWRTVSFNDPRLYAALAASVAMYAAGTVALGFGWVRWLRAAGGAPFSTFAGVVIYGRSQIAKYIPGNVFHFVARQALGNRLGAPHSALILSAAAETAALVTVACALGAFGGGLPAPFPHIPRAAALTVGVLCLAAAVPLSSWLARRDPVRRSPARRLLDTLVTLLFYVPFFTGNGLCLALLLSLNHAGDSPSIQVLVGIWSICWLAGYLVPGSPGGLGVREAALVYALSGWCSRPEALVLAAELRLVSTLGDVTLWLASFGGNGAIEPAAAPAPSKCSSL